MFTAEDIHPRIQRRPFVPLRIRTTANQVYDIYHPDLVMVTRRFLIIGTGSKRNPLVADSVAQIAVIHVTELEDLSSSPRSSRNGRKRKH